MASLSAWTALSTSFGFQVKPWMPFVKNSFICFPSAATMGVPLLIASRKTRNKSTAWTIRVTLPDASRPDGQVLLHYSLIRSFGHGKAGLQALSLGRISHLLEESKLPRVLLRCHRCPSSFVGTRRSSFPELRRCFWQGVCCSAVSAASRLLITRKCYIKDWCPNWKIIFF